MVAWAQTGDVFFADAVSAVVVYGAWRALDYVHVHIGLGAFGPAFVDGAATFARVVVLLTMLRCIAGLIAPSAGTVSYRARR
jgi:NitT/TauT family transport system permease protein